MNNKLRFIEILFMVILILAFAMTGIFIMQGKNDYAIISLSATSGIVLIEFYFVMTGQTGRVIDLRGATNRNPKGKYGTGDYSDPLFEEDYDYSSKSVHSLSEVKSRSGRSGNNSAFTGALSNRTGEMTFSSEGVGNMRVYQRGEKIDYANSED